MSKHILFSQRYIWRWEYTRIQEKRERAAWPLSYDRLNVPLAAFSSAQAFCALPGYYTIDLSSMALFRHCARSCYFVDVVRMNVRTHEDTQRYTDTRTKAFKQLQTHPRTHASSQCHPAPRATFPPTRTHVRTHGLHTHPYVCAHPSARSRMHTNNDTH